MERRVGLPRVRFTRALIFVAIAARGAAVKRGRNEGKADAAERARRGGPDAGAGFRLPEDSTAHQLRSWAHGWFTH